MSSSNPVFVRVDNPLLLKKTILQSAIDSVILMKEYERLKYVQQEAENITSRFINIIQHIESQIDMLHSFIPSVRVPGQRSNINYNVEVVNESEYEIPSGNLEDELKDIEEKLKTII